MKRIVQWSIDHHWIVIGLSVLLFVAGAWTARQMPIDVFPDLTAPTDTIQSRIDEFERVCRTVPFKAPTVRLLSNVTSGWITGAEATDPVYWARRLQRTGSLGDCLATLLDLANGIFIEIGPGRTLTHLLAERPNAPKVVTPTLRRPDEAGSDVALILTAVGRLWAAGAPIDAYGNGGFRFAGMSHRGSLLCLPSGIHGWEPADPAALTLRDFDRVLAEAGGVDILLVGTGPELKPLPRDLRQALRDARISADPMSTGSAVRTFNVLLGEQRRVVAALFNR